MHSGVSTIQAMSQERLKGNPNTIGSTRSHSDTEKHMAANGMSASAIAAVEGLLKYASALGMSGIGAGS